MTLDLTSGGSVKGSREHEEEKERAERDGVVIVVRDDKNEDTGRSG